MSREYCEECTRPRSECYCSDIVEIESPVKIIIIQHPKEQKHPYNTGRIVHKCIANSELIIAEVLDTKNIDQLVTADSTLLFPEMNWLAPSAEPQVPVKQLIVIDATWKKAKKILHLNPDLQRLPRLSLSEQSKSNYQIRTSTVPNGLSTIESVTEALESLQPKMQFDKLLIPFQKMVSLAQRYIPE